jgi:sec-independent protein translocase protein TatB
MGTVPPIEVANLGMADSLILMVMALVVFGPRRLPQIGRQIGKLMYEFRKASNDFKFQMEEELRNAEDADRRLKEEQRVATLALTTTAPDEPAAPDVVAQVLEPAIGVPGYYEANTTESPYPGEGQYPGATETGGQPEEPNPPRIQPPATGEPVPYGTAAAAEPASEPAPAVAGEAQAEAAPAPVDAAAAPEEVPAKESTAVTEQAAHHG